MKPKLNGNFADLYENRATIRRKTAVFNGVEWIQRHDTTHYYNGEVNPNGKIYYTVNICGVHKTTGVYMAAYFHPGEDTAYFWQYADRAAVADILDHPGNAYNWLCVKNGLRNPK